MSPLGPVLVLGLSWAPVGLGEGALSTNICRGKGVGLMGHNQPCPLPPEVQHWAWADFPLTRRRAIFWEPLFFSLKSLYSFHLNDIIELLMAYSLLSPCSNQVHFGKDFFFFFTTGPFIQNIFMEYLQSSGTMSCGRETGVNRREKIFVLWGLYAVLNPGNKKK